ncbi:MAG: rRNA maturation RNase YbeY [Bacteroidia bacterium]|jgi:rRNA maturation RNase YbeY|nr:rRNA maturation RNase YbeY [Bacteroidia bacterium]
MITFHALDVELPVWLNQRPLSRWINEVIVQHGFFAGELSYILCSDNKLLEINKKHLDHDYYTDIITFNLSTSFKIIRGEIYISLERVGENAKKMNQTIENELNRVLIHGVLHLMGYQDHTDEDRSEMRAKEDYCLSLLP